MAHSTGIEIPPFPPPPYADVYPQPFNSGIPSAPPVGFMEQLAPSPTHIYCTVDQYKLHIAYNQYYQGSINSYNWWLTKLFAKIFGWSVGVTIAGKERQLEKKSYLAYLVDHGMNQTTMQTLHTLTHLDPTSHIRLENKGSMTQALSKEKVHSLSLKMITALIHKEEQLAIQMLGKGAKLNSVFWIDDERDALFYRGKDENKFRKTLPEKRIPRFTVTKYTPLLYSGSKGMEELKTKLTNLGANTTLRGVQLAFERQINDVQSHNEHALRVQNVVEPSIFISSKGPKTTFSLKTEWRWDKTTTITTTYSDKIETLQTIYFDIGTRRVVSRVYEPEGKNTREFTWERSARNTHNIISFRH